MKKVILALSLLSCSCIFPRGLTQAGYAQPANLNYSQVLILTKQDLESQNYEVAEKNARQLITTAKSPEETAQALLTLGETFYLRKMFEPARAEWNKVLALPADDNTEAFQAFAKLNLGRSYSAQGRFDQAVPFYKTFIEVFDQIDALDQDEKREGKEGENEKGQDNKLEEKKIFVSLAFANALYQTEQYDLAQQQFEKIIQSSQDAPLIQMLALTRSSDIDFMKLRLKKAVAGFEQVLVLATKEKAELTQKYARRQMEFAKANQAAWEGGGSGHIKIKLTLRGSADDLRMNTIVQTLSDVFVDDLMIKMLEE